MSKRRRQVTTLNILKRARELVQSRLPHTWATCWYDLGPFCPRCAAAKATTEMTKGMHFMAGDAALEYAAMCIGTAEGNTEKLTRKEALAVIDQAIAFRRRAGRGRP